MVQPLVGRKLFVASKQQCACINDFNPALIVCVSTSLYEVVTGKMSQYVFCHVNPISVFALFNFNFMLKRVGNRPH